MRRARVAGGLAAAALAAALTAGCSNGATGNQPTWVPQQDFQANAEPQPELPGNGLPAPSPSAPGNGPQPSNPNGGSSGSSPSPSTTVDPAVVATKLNQPTGLIVLPDGTALVGERTTGRIVLVQPTAGKPIKVIQTLPGVDGAGDGGLLDLALSPTFDQDGLIYAYLTTSTDNRVVHFSIGGAPTPVIVGIPRGTSGNVGRIAFDGTGALLVGTGDAGIPALAAAGTSLAGKVLRSDDVGKPVTGNPNASSIIFASGLAAVNGLCVDPQSGLRVAISAGRPDEVNEIKAGASYGWPTRGSNSTVASATLPAGLSGAGGCALRNGQLVVATSTGTALASATIDSKAVIGTFTPVLQGKYGRLRTVVAGSDGALWLTTSNRDGKGKPVSDDDRVIRIPASAASGNSPL
ncbi:PQQ-dependent sugar dehydrogenase [Jatrophihabitans sp. DSM 45814]